MHNACHNTHMHNAYTNSCRNDACVTESSSKELEKHCSGRHV